MDMVMDNEREEVEVIDIACEEKVGESIDLTSFDFRADEHNFAQPTEVSSGEDGKKK